MPDRIDEFESVFRAADKPRFVYRRPRISRIAVVVDTEASDDATYLDAVRSYLQPCQLDDVSFETVGRDRFSTVAELMDALAGDAPDLIVTYRNLHVARGELHHSLGAHVDTLIRATSVPVLLTQRPDHDPADRLGAIRNVLVLTDHMTEDSKTINYGVRLTAKGGTVFLAHIEDDATFERYMHAIERIPAVETDEVRRGLREQLLGRASDYIASVAAVLKERSVSANVSASVRLGHRVADCQQLIDEHVGDLLVCSINDREREALRPIAYAIAVRYRHQPLLLV